MATVSLAFLVAEGFWVHGWRLQMRCNDRKRSITTLLATSVTGSSTSANNLNLLPMGEADICFRRGAELEKIGQVRHALIYAIQSRLLCNKGTGLLYPPLLYE
jgi:hypothetical protein